MRKSCRISVIVLAALALIVVLVASPAADASKPKPTTKPPSFETVVPGVLTVAADVGIVGFMNGTDPNHITGGVEYEMVKAFAHDLHLKLVIQNAGFTPLVAGAVTGYDVGVATIFKNPAREQVNQYSIPYYCNPTAIMVKKGVVVKTVADLQKLNLGYVTGSSQGLLAQAINPAGQKSYDSSVPMYEDLLGGGINGALNGLAATAGKLSLPGYGGYYIPAVISQPSQPYNCMAVQLPKSAPVGNLAFINREIVKLSRNGLLAKWKKEFISPLADKKYPKIVVQG